MIANFTNYHFKLQTRITSLSFISSVDSYMNCVMGLIHK